jgi:hypothetical protein
MKTEVFERITVRQIATYWFSNVALFSALYYGLSFAGASILQDGQALTTSLEGLGNSIYFSFTTALTLGYANIAPLGIAKALAVLEAIGSISLFGLFIGKLVSVKQEQILEEIKELTVEEATHKAITELCLFRIQAKELQEKLAKSKKNKNLSKELESLHLTLIDAMQTFNDAKIKINDPHKSMMHLSLITNSMTYSLSRLVELLEEFNKRKIGWNKESTTTAHAETVRTKEILSQNFEKLKSDDQSSNIAREKLEDLNKAIEELQKSAQR